MPGPHTDDRDWSALSTSQRIRQLEVEGYLVMPDLLDPDHLTRLKAITPTFKTTAVDYSENQRGRPNIQFEGGEVTQLIGHAPILEFLRQLFGDEIIFMHYGYARSEPGHPGISLHTDGQPYGSKIFGFEGSCPVLVRVLYYLDDLTAEVSPFRVVPRTHLSFHNQANPYLRYEEHPEEVMVTCKAGAAVVFSHNLFHGNYPNVGTYARESIQLSYRPTWSGPTGEVEPWDPAEVAKCAAPVRPLLGDRSARIWIYDGGNKPPDMPRQAPGINPSRWERD